MSNKSAVVIFIIVAFLSGCWVGATAALSIFPPGEKANTENCSDESDSSFEQMRHEVRYLSAI